MKKTYILAISGGVDSVVLLHLFAQRRAEALQKNDELTNLPVVVVAHFDHGIRPDSHIDEQLVRSLAKQYDLSYVSERAELGPDVNESDARDARYGFLRSVASRLGAEAIVTAHHQDDVLESMILNIVRRGGARGLIGYTAPDIVRPLMNWTKQRVLDYAQRYSLSWREDSTNQDTHHTRNYIRHTVMPKLGDVERGKLLSIRARLQDVFVEIDHTTSSLLVQSTHSGGLLRGRFVLLPYSVQKQVMARWLSMSGVDITTTAVETAVHAARSGRPGTEYDITKNTRLKSTADSVLLEIRCRGV